VGREGGEGWRDERRDRSTRAGKGEAGTGGRAPLASCMCVDAHTHGMLGFRSKGGGGEAGIRTSNCSCDFSSFLLGVAALLAAAAEGDDDDDAIASEGLLLCLCVVWLWTNRH